MSADAYLLELSDGQVSEVPLGLAQKVGVIPQGPLPWLPRWEEGVVERLLFPFLIYSAQKAGVPERVSTRQAAL